MLPTEKSFKKVTCPFKVVTTMVLKSPQKFLKSSKMIPKVTIDGPDVTKKWFYRHHK